MKEHQADPSKPDEEITFSCLYFKIIIIIYLKGRRYIEM